MPSTLDKIDLKLSATCTLFGLQKIARFLLPIILQPVGPIVVTFVNRECCITDNVHIQWKPVTPVTNRPQNLAIFNMFFK